MRFKLDENLGWAAGRRLLAAGHDVRTVAEQGLSGAADEALATICGEEGRCLVTLDLDFSNPLRFPPSRYAGIVVLRLPEPASVDSLLASLDSLIQALAMREVVGKLWVVREGGIREYWEELDEDV